MSREIPQPSSLNCEAITGIEMTGLYIIPFLEQSKPRARTNLLRQAKRFGNRVIWQAWEATAVSPKRRFFGIIKK